MQLGAVPIQTLETIDKVYSVSAGFIIDVANITLQLSSSKNAEIRFRWYQLGIRAEWPAIVAGTVEFLVSQGRMKYVRPLYRLVANNSNLSSILIRLSTENSARARSATKARLIPSRLIRICTTPSLKR